MKSKKNKDNNDTRVSSVVDVQSSFVAHACILSTGQGLEEGRPTRRIQHISCSR